MVSSHSDYSLQREFFCQNDPGFCRPSQGPQPLPVNESQKDKAEPDVPVFLYRQGWCDLLFKKLSAADTLRTKVLPSLTVLRQNWCWQY